MKQVSQSDFLRPNSIIQCIVTNMIPARQRVGKHGPKAGIAAEAEVNLLGNDTQKHLFPRQRILTKAFL
jgi:hypothetical protein